MRLTYPKLAIFAHMTRFSGKRTENRRFLGRRPHLTQQSAAKMRGDVCQRGMRWRDVAREAEHCQDAGDVCRAISRQDNLHKMVE